MHLWYKVHWRWAWTYEGYDASNNYPAFPKWTQNICLRWFISCLCSLEIIMFLQIKMVAEYASTKQRMYACLSTLFRYLFRWCFCRGMQTERVRGIFGYTDCHSGLLRSIDWMTWPVWMWGNFPVSCSIIYLPHLCWYHPLDNFFFYARDQSIMYLKISKWLVLSTVHNERERTSYQNFTHWLRTTSK